MSRIYVFTAMNTEANAILQLAESKGTHQNYVSGVPIHVGSNELHVILSGMGPKKAKASATQALRPWLEHNRPSLASHPKPDFVLVTGLCGGLTELVEKGQIVAYSNCLADWKEPALVCGASLTQCLPEILTRHGIACRVVDGVTSSRIATNRSSREVLSRSGASVVDMESYELLAVAASCEIPAAVLRIVGDSFDQQLPNFNRAIDADGNFDGHKALAVALGSPVRTLRLMASNKHALRQLAPALRIVLSAHWPMGS